MNFLLKIYDIDGTIKTQIINPEGLSFTKELSGIGELNFTLAIKSDDALEIRSWRKVELFGNDRKMWTGYIINYTYTLNFVEIECATEKKLLDKKIIIADLDFNNNVETLLDTLTTQANSRSTGLEPPLTYSTSLTETVNLEWTQGSTFYDILQDVADFLECEWDIVDNEIIVNETIGKDRTISGDDFVELISSLNSPSQNNIAKVEFENNAVQISNYVLGKNSGSTNTQSDLTTGFGVKETAQSFHNGNLNEQVLQYLEKHKGEYQTINVEPSAVFTDLLAVEVGDKVKMRIDRGSELIDGDYELKVIKTKISVENAMPVLQFELSEKNRTILNAKNFFSEIERRIKLEELNS